MTNEFKDFLINYDLDNDNDTMKAYSPAENTILADFFLRPYLEYQYNPIGILNDVFDKKFERPTFDELKKNQNRTQINEYRGYVKMKFKLIQDSTNKNNINLAEDLAEDSPIKANFDIRNELSTIIRDSKDKNKDDKKDETENNDENKKYRFDIIDKHELENILKNGETLDCTGAFLFILRALGPDLIPICFDYEEFLSYESKSDNFICLLFDTVEEKNNFLKSSSFKDSITKTINPFADFHPLEPEVFENRHSSANRLLPYLKRVKELLEGEKGIEFLSKLNEVYRYIVINFPNTFFFEGKIVPKGYHFEIYRKVGTKGKDAILVLGLHAESTNAEKNDKFIEFIEGKIKGIFKTRTVKEEEDGYLKTDKNRRWLSIKEYSLTTNPSIIVNDIKIIDEILLGKN